MRVLLVLALASLGCSNGDGAADAASIDASTTPDAGSDAASTPDAGNDAFVVVDGGHDAFASTDAFVGTDANRATAWNACTVTSDCDLENAGCCRPCHVPTLADVDAVNTMQSDVHMMDVCPEPRSCPRCATLPNADLIATCDSMICEALDLSTLPLTACVNDADCVLRHADCCDCADSEAPVLSIRADGEAAIEALLCDPGGCPADCTSMPSTDYTATCDTDTHHCVASPVT